jgi:putative membrane protein
MIQLSKTSCWISDPALKIGGNKMMFGNGYFGGGFHGVGNCLGFGGGYMHGGFMMLAFLLLTLAAILGAVLIFRRSRAGQADKAVMEALKMRLVSGEISEEEYISKKNALK